METGNEAILLSHDPHHFKLVLLLNVLPTDLVSILYVQVYMQLLAALRLNLVARFWQVDDYPTHPAFLTLVTGNWNKYHLGNMTFLYCFQGDTWPFGRFPV